MRTWTAEGGALRWEHRVRPLPQPHQTNTNIALFHRSPQSNLSHPELPCFPSFSSLFDTVAERPPCEERYVYLH
jgi:hypothetical protein